MAQVFPRLGLYGSVLGGGYPYVLPDFTLDTLAGSNPIEEQSRLGEVSA
jgi:hypothetical protein